MSETKKDAITLKSPWVMSCAFEKTEQRFVACGGLDNICTVYDLRNPVVPAYELVGHDGYLSCCAFVGAGGKAMLTSSGDSTCILWDAERAVRKQTFKDHSADVMRCGEEDSSSHLLPPTPPPRRSVSLHPTDPNVFASGSCDSTVRVWDIRLNSCVRTFTGHISDINSVEFFPSGTVVGSGSDDSSCRLFDLRSCGPINIFTGESGVGGGGYLIAVSPGVLLVLRQRTRSSVGSRMLHFRAPGASCSLGTRRTFASHGKRRAKTGTFMRTDCQARSVRCLSASSTLPLLSVIAEHSTS